MFPAIEDIAICVTVTREAHLHTALSLRRSNAKRPTYVRIIVRKLRKRSVVIQAVRTDARLAGARVARPRNSFAPVRKHRAFIIFGISASDEQLAHPRFDLRLSRTRAGTFRRKGGEGKTLPLTNYRLARASLLFFFSPKLPEKLVRASTGPRRGRVFIYPPRCDSHRI